MFRSIFIVTCLFFMAGNASAITCLSGCNEAITTTISNTLNSDDNEVGKEVNSNQVSTTTFRVRLASGTLSDWHVYGDDPVPEPGYSPSSWVYKKIDDYISLALKIETGCFVRYFPSNTQALDDGCGPATFSEGEEREVGPYTFQSRVRIDKKIVSGTYSKNIYLGSYGRCQPFGCKSKDVVYNRIYVNLSITVPQSCELNAGQVINIDFGNISSGAFKTAGAIAQGVQPKSRDISVKCDNIAGNAQLTLRLQADKTNGNIVVSDENNDVGFRVTNNSGTPLIPNNLSSVIPFTLDSNARQNVTIQAYPVSVTGNKPTEGAVTSRAYLRVDFP